MVGCFPSVSYIDPKFDAQNHISQAWWCRLGIPTVTGASRQFKKALICMGVLPMGVCVHHVCLGLLRPEEGIVRTGVKSDCELPHGCRELNLGLLEEYPVL